MSDALAVELSDVHKAFGVVPALRGLDLRVPRGLIYGVLGPNGAGKTTAIRTIAGLLRPDRGQARVLGEAAGARSVRARIGYMPQAAALYDELSVRANVEFFASLALDDPSPAVDPILEVVDVADRATSPVHTLSGGLKQRVSLACALAHAPDVLLLDEPTVGVDPTLRAAFWSYFRDLTDRGASILVSSHVMDEAARCDRLGLIREGRLLRDGTVGDLLSGTNATTLEQAFLTLAADADVAT